jgi:hypothetical protein
MWQSCNNHNSLNWLHPETAKETRTLRGNPCPIFLVSKFMYERRFKLPDTSSSKYLKLLLLVEFEKFLEEAIQKEAIPSSFKQIRVYSILKKASNCKSGAVSGKVRNVG